MAFQYKMYERGRRRGIAVLFAQSQRIGEYRD